MNPTLIYPGIYRIKLPLAGKKPGPVNVYLFKGKDNITLLDTGTDLTWRYLEDRLKRIGVKFRDIDRIVMTHGHVDHYGAAKRVLDGGSGRARVYAHAADARPIKTGRDVPSGAYRQFLISTGTPLRYHLGIVPMFFLFRMKLARPCPVHEHINVNEPMMLGDYTARVIETPGHTRGSVCFFLEKERLLFSGDHILGHITPNAFPMLEKDSLPKRISQKEFYASLDLIRDINPAIVHPAHGKVIRDFSLIHRVYTTCFAQRQEAIFQTINNHPGKSVYDMARSHFPEINGSHRFLLDLYLAVSEIFTHIQVLEDHGRVKTRLINRILHVETIK
ncbi:MAG: MBL fold metallo-hydrolase [Desulfobacteraceae bacterium]